MTETQMTPSEYKACFDAYKAWLDALKPGDEVCYVPNKGFFDRTPRICKVLTRTKTRRIRLDDGTVWYPYGRGMGRLTTCYLQPITDSIRMKLTRNQMVLYLHSVKWESLPAEALLKVAEVLSEYQAENETENR